MASQGDLQELLRMFTARKVPMLAAMGHVKSLQAKNLKSIEQIADAPLKTVEEALKDAKLAKGFHTACKAHSKKPAAAAAAKRGAEDATTSPTSKKPRLEPTKRDLDYSAMAADDLEASLELPLVEDEALIRATTVVTNRAPLVLAFAVELLRATMPEQPPSSRLSLAQALVSANSRSKAVSIGIEKPSLAAAPVAEGQPKVRVMGREIPVLKRGDYTWSGAPENTNTGSDSTGSASAQGSSTKKRTWTASATLTSRASTFIAHAAAVSSAGARPALVRQLMAERPDLETASHNAWAIRTSFGNSPLVQQASFDDGESGCGKFMLEIMKESNVTNTLVVLTRWFGGVMLGPDRWRLMREAVHDALASAQRTAPTFTPGEAAVWGLDAEDTNPATSTVGMGIHRPEGARNYLLRSFASPEGGGGGGGKKSMTVAAANEEKQENLGRVLGALRIVVESWKGVLSKDELDKRAWNWYVAVRPDVQSGPAGWGARGELQLSKILDLKRNVG